MKNKRTYFEEIIKRQKESGKSAVVFCQELGISYSTFRYWVKKTRDNSDNIKMELIPVTIQYGFDMEHIGEIIYPNGVKLRLTGNLSRTDLAALIIYKVKIMFSLNDAHKYYLCPIPMDMRKGFDTLSGVVRSQMKRDPLSGEVFIFINKNRNTIKLLHWEKGGLVLYHKRLERGSIELPKYDEVSGSYKLQWSDWVLMIEGIKLSDAIRRKRFEMPVNKGF